MFRKMVSLLPVESLVAISSKDSGGNKMRINEVTPSPSVMT